MSINKLDTLDYKILYELDGNARAAYSEIATKLKVSKQTVKNRMDKLIEDKIIKTFLQSLMKIILGLNHYIFLLRLIKFQQKNIKKSLIICSKIKKLPK